ncbi:MAG: hypothetical protein KA188_00385 [Leadbetterella sp.]|nr:hypothetical protein [Leadbetterella sp.]
MKTLKSRKTIIVSDRVKLEIPGINKHMRVIEIRLPYQFKNRPSIIASISSTDSPGTIMALYDTTYNDLGTQSQIVFGANNINEGQQVDFEYWCDYIVMGELL